MPVVSHETDQRPELIAWFAALVNAHFRSNHRAAAEALDALERRGVTVTFATKSAERRKSIRRARNEGGRDAR